MEARATAATVRITPRKMRLVVDVVRGKSVDEALAILANTNTSASPVVSKLIKSAAANAVKNHEMNGSKLYVKEIFANDSVRMKRYMPRAKGAASGLIKRTCNVTCVLAER